MAYTSEIEKLEKRWAENPKGRNFAPLADAYRKAGELDRALELCKAGLDLHPDYVSAHIVYARCLIDQKNDAGASEVFRKVLALDPENVLALKILADIAERGGRFDEAVEWLGRLLNADPMNGDAAEALVRAKAKAAQAVPKVTAAEPVVRLVPAPTPASAPAPRSSEPPPPPLPPPPAPPALVVEHVSEGPPAPVLDVKAAPSDIETFDGTLDFNAVAHDAARADGLEVQEEVELKPQDLVVEGLARSPFDSGQFPRPAEAEAPSDEVPVELPLIMPDDLGPPFAPEAESPSPSPFPPPAAPEAPPAPAPAPVTGRVPTASGTRGSGVGGAPPAAVALSDDDGAADTAALSRAEPVLTETMAELYLRQGHADDALRVYQALLGQRPGDARLRARVDALTGGGTGETVHAFLKRILAGRPVAARPPEPPPSSGSPLDGAFAAASMEVESTPDVDAPGEATRPAGDNISLDQVFGEEGGRGSLPAAEAPPES
ncbi:MAG TPA: tetratricopeptide repeat protein, partial [Gemmatimonadales bacterium]|nr:tetratricopeptide repeat protein [Gemmatimonadales bacterium]